MNTTPIVKRAPQTFFWLCRASAAFSAAFLLRFWRLLPIVRGRGDGELASLRALLLATTRVGRERERESLLRELPLADMSRVDARRSTVSCAAKSAACGGGLSGYGHPC